MAQHISQLFSKFPYQTRPNILLYLSHTVQHKSILSCFCATVISHMLDTRNFHRHTTPRQFSSINSPDTTLPSYTHFIHNWFPTNHFAVIHKIHNFIQKNIECPNCYKNCLNRYHRDQKNAAIYFIKFHSKTSQKYCSL